MKINIIQSDSQTGAFHAPNNERYNKVWLHQHMANNNNSLNVMTCVSVNEKH